MKSPPIPFGFVACILSAVAGGALGLPTVCLAEAPAAAPKGRLPVRLDARGPYLILATDKAARAYADAIGKASALHPAAAHATFAPDDSAAALTLLREHRPRYVLLFVLPGELDVNFAWRWLTLTTQVNDDPLVDARTGFVTGRTPADAAAFVDRIAAAAGGTAALPGRLVDNFGPNAQARKGDFSQRPGNVMLPALGRRLDLASISHGVEAFTDDRLGSMAGAGLVHFGGHGHPDGIDDGLRGGQAKGLRLSPCVAFNGACYTGVTGRWFDTWTTDGTVAEATVGPADSFCLSVLTTEAVAYLAALHPDHGVPVYQEMEYLAYAGASLGDVIKHTHDGVVLAAGGRLPAFEPLKAGSPAPKWTPAEVMLNGTAARVLFGDPSMVVAGAFTGPPFDVVATEDGGALRVTATLANPSLRSTYTDTYYADLSSNKDLFNDRALLDVGLPTGWDAVKSVEVVGVTAKDKPLKYRLVGYAVERDEDAAGRRLHVQVDVPSDGYMQSAFRVTGATVELRVTRQSDKAGPQGQ